MPPMDAAAPPPVVVSRLGREGFAVRAAIRQIGNEPGEIARILWGVKDRRPLDDVVVDLHEALPDELPRLRPSSPYYEACGHAQRQFEHYRRLSATLSLDHIKALSMYTLENPRYYDIQNKAAYRTYAGQEHRAFPLFAQIIAYINTGLHELAALHRCGDLQPRQPERLVRFAWISDAVWEQHYREGNSVVFLTPMSASPMWGDNAEREMSPVWELLDRHRAGHTPCLLEFDSVLARQAGQLGHPLHPISVYGPAENEWTLPSYIRGSVVSITEVGVPGGRHVTIPHVRVEGLPMLSPIRIWTRRDIPDLCQGTAAVLLAAVTLAGFAEHGSGEAPATRLLEDFCESLASAVEVRAPGSYLRRTLNFLLGPSLTSTLFLDSARRLAETSTQEQISRMLAEAGGFQEDLERWAKEIRNDLKSAALHVKDLMGELATSAHSTRQLKLLVLVEFLADVFDVRQESAEMLVDAAPLLSLQGRQFLEPIDRLGDALWAPAPPQAPPELHAWRAAAWLDCLRVRLATTRIVVLAGGPHAGKTTLLEQVFGIPSRGGAEHRTAKATFYHHPMYNAELVPAYVVDTSGFGDSAWRPNNMVRCLLHCISALGPGVGFVWVMRAGRDVETVADELYSLLLPLCRLVVVTCVDTMLEARLCDLYEDLDGMAFDFDDEEALQNERLSLMLSVREETHQRVQRLSGDRPPPPVRFAVLPPGSWASTESQGGRRRPRSPPPWLTAREDVTAVFDLISAGALRQLLDLELGLDEDPGNAHLGEVDAVTRVEQARREGWQALLREADRAEVAFRSTMHAAEAWLAGQADLKFGSFTDFRRIGRHRTGAGHYGCNSAVYSAEGGGGRWAIKVVYNIHQDATGQVEERYVAEYTLLAKLSHPNIARLSRRFVDRASRDRLPDWDAHSEFVSATSLCLVGALMQTTAKSEIGRARAAGQRVGDAQLLHISLRVARGLAYMAQQKIVHRDLKPDNLFLGGPAIKGVWAVVQIGDFGEALDCGADGLDGSFRVGFPNRHFNRGGAITYLPPEIVTPAPGRDVVLDYSRSDAWALGRTMYDLASASDVSPFAADRHALYSADTYRDLPGAVPRGVRELVRRLLATDMRQRPDAAAAAECLQCPWELVDGAVEQTPEGPPGRQTRCILQ